MTEYEELHTEIMYLAHRQKETEDRMDALADWADVLSKELQKWTEVITIEVLRQGVEIQKKQNNEGYFRKTSSENWKDVYGKLEDLLSKVKGLSGEAKRGKYNDYSQ